MPRLALRAFLVSCFAAATLLAARAHAQAPMVASPGPAALDLHAREELSSIDAESTAATVLYGVGIPLLPLGVLTALAGAIAGSGGNPDTATWLIATGLGGAGLGLISLCVAIGLDADSGSRRGGWQQRRAAGAQVTFFAAPLQGGLALGLAGTL